ncbi:MAG: bacteriohemerythrin [Steroidobacteraceae bacterium]|jgi:hemerythrin-like metal-binding protein|nr:bacteriohemerythrin [Steroidobacteraceae bacterium]
MTVLAWDPIRFDVGVARMNDEHRVLVGLMNDIHDRAGAGAGKAELQGLFRKLADATVRHFKGEEAYLESIGYADLRTHKAIHAKLLADFTAHVARFEAGDGRVEKAFFDFLSLWLRSHICHVDMKYGPNAGRKAG